jgi:hypothetical protein
MSLESALAHYSKAYEQKTPSLQELSKASPSPALDASQFFGLAKSATEAAMVRSGERTLAYNTSAANETEADTAWREVIFTLLADAIALGRELDRENFQRDPKVGLALELVRQQLRADPVENNSFVAELLEIALDNATEIASSDADHKGATALPDAQRAIAETKWSTTQKQQAAVLAAGVKRIKDTPVQNPLEQMSVAKGKSLARESWKIIEPRATFWDRPTRKSAAVQKFTGKTPDQIRRDAKELAAKTERECAESLAKINGGDFTKLEGSNTKALSPEQRRNGWCFDEKGNKCWRAQK